MSKAQKSSQGHLSPVMTGPWLMVDLAMPWLGGVEFVRHKHGQEIQISMASHLETEYSDLRTQGNPETIKRLLYRQA